jgi:hypothetical protein
MDRLLQSNRLPVGGRRHGSRGDPSRIIATVHDVMAL